MNRKKILFLGTHGQHNIGDELLLETFLSQLGDQHEYSVNSYDPDFTIKQLGESFNIKVFHTTQDRSQTPALILQSDLVFFGGGQYSKRALCQCEAQPVCDIVDGIGGRRVC